MISNRMKIVAVKFIACLGIVMLFGQLVEAQWVKSTLPYTNSLGIGALAVNGKILSQAQNMGFSIPQTAV